MQALLEKFVFVVVETSFKVQLRIKLNKKAIFYIFLEIF